MLKADIHPKIVQERLDNASITQTLDTYSHVIPSMQKKAVQKLKNSLKNEYSDKMATFLSKLKMSLSLRQPLTFDISVFKNGRADWI